MLVAFRQAIKVLSANLVRTGLTTLGIIIGIATVVLVLSAGEGFRGLINSVLETYGTNTLFVETRVPPTTKNRDIGAFGNDSSRAMSPVAITSLKTRDLEDIKRLPNVESNYGLVVGQKVVSYRGVEKSVLFYGASSDRFDIDKGTLEAGRFYTAAEERGADQVVILGANLANDLFGQDDPLGKRVRVGDLNFTVIGVYNPRGSLGNGEDDSLYMPLSTAQKKVLGIDHLLFAIVSVKDIKFAAATAEDIRAVLRQNHNVDDPYKDDFFVQTQSDTLNTFNTIFNGITILLIAIAAISLIVGGVGIMNIMYVAVKERTAEIGLRKAVGALPKNILKQFLIEAALLTVIAGIIGLVVGAGIAAAVAAVANYLGYSWKFVISLFSVLLSVAVSSAIGLAFGYLPAKKAARMDPIEALRYE